MTDIVTPPSIDALPGAPLPTDPPEVFDAKAFATLAAQSPMVTQINAANAATQQNATAANERANAAASSASAAAVSAGAAATAKTQAESARDLAQTYAGLAGEAAGFPSLVGNAGKVVRVNETETGVVFAPDFDFRPGDVYLSTSAPASGTWLPCLGGVYLQSSYTALFAELGVLVNQPQFLNTWSIKTIPTGTRPGIAFGAGLFVALSTGTATCHTSPDGITWTAQTLPVSATWQSVTFGNGVFVMTGVNTLLTSPDGVTWTTRTVSTGNWAAVVYGGGQFVAVVSSAAKAATSPDGVTWTDRTLPSSRAWRAVTYGGGMYVAVAGSVANTVALSSPDGITWTERALPISAEWQSVAYGNGVFVAINKTVATTAAKSLDGITWTTMTIPATSASPVCIIYGAGYFVMVTGSTVNALTSPDGANWNLVSLSVSAIWQSVAYGNGVFVAVSSSSTNASVGGPLYSYDTNTQFATPIQPVAQGLTAWIKA